MVKWSRNDEKIYPGDIIEIIDSGQWEVQRNLGSNDESQNTKSY